MTTNFARLEFDPPSADYETVKFDEFVKINAGWRRKKLIYKA